MANEITATCTLTCTKSGVTTTGNVAKAVTLAGVGQWQNTQAIGTAAELLAFPGDLTTEGVTFIWLYNMDATNYVELALNDFTQIFAKLLAGQAMMIRSYTANPTYYARANTAAVNLRMTAVGT